MRKCKYCNELYSPNRNDQKFCGVKCRSTSYNSRKSTDTKAIRRHLIMISHNRNVLKELYLLKGDELFDKFELSRRDYHFNYLTKIRAKENGNILHIVGEYMLENVIDDQHRVSKAKLFG